MSSSVNGMVSKWLSNTNARFNYCISEKETIWLGKVIDNRIYIYNGSGQQLIWIGNLQEGVSNG